MRSSHPLDPCTGIQMPSARAGAAVPDTAALPGHARQRGHVAQCDGGQVCGSQPQLHGAASTCHPAPCPAEASALANAESSLVQSIQTCRQLGMIRASGAGATQVYQEKHPALRCRAASALWRTRWAACSRGTSCRASRACTQRCRCTTSRPVARPTAPWQPWNDSGDHQDAAVLHPAAVMSQVGVHL